MGLSIPNMIPTIKRAVLNFRKRLPSRTSLFFIIISIALGCLYFRYTRAIPPQFRGVYWGDSMDYMGCSRGGLWRAFQHSSLRLFGYPFFIAIFREMYPGEYEFLNPMLSAQLVCHFLSVLILVWALTRTGVRASRTSFLLLIIHPGLIAMSTITMTDSLTTSIFNCVLAVILFLTYQPTRLLFKSFSLGLLLGLVISLRPSFIPIAALTPLLVGLSVLLRQHSSSGNWRKSLQVSILCVMLCVLGIAPTYVHLRMNCYRAHHEQCIIPSSATVGISETFNYAIEYSRYDIIFRPDGAPEAAPTRDRVFPFGSCTISKTNPAASLFACYIQNAASLPLYFSHRVVGLFDNRQINIYGGGRTPEWIFWTNRIYSVVGFLGFFGSFALILRGLLDRQLKSYLLVPVLYILIQLNFHVESRYTFPVTPIFFVTGITFLMEPPFRGTWCKAVTWLTALVLAAGFFHITNSWDITYFELHHFK